MRKLLQILVFGALLCGIAWGGVAGHATAFSDEQKLLAEAWRVVDRAYIDHTFNNQNWWKVRQKALSKPLPDRETTYSTIREILALLDDPFTRLLEPEQYRSLQTNTSGELTGVGLQIALDGDGGVQVIAPLDGSPAEQAGLQPLDVILAIDGISTEGLSLDEAAELMRGPIGSRVVLTIARRGQPSADIEVQRDLIVLNPVTSALKAGSMGEKIGYIRLTQFNANAAIETERAIETLDSEGAEGFILDLRSNPGGLLQAGIEIARLWLSQSTVVYTVNRQGILDSFDSYDKALTDAPLVVLVNQGTASASEILAGALQDNHRATLVGERTFGKGLIQSLFTLSDGSGLAVTVAKYETPAHRDINKQGIQPDIEVGGVLLERSDLATERDVQYQAAVDWLTHDRVLADAA